MGIRSGFRSSRPKESGASCSQTRRRRSTPFCSIIGLLCLGFPSHRCGRFRNALIVGTVVLPSYSFTSALLHDCLQDTPEPDSGGSCDDVILSFFFSGLVCEGGAVLCVTRVSIAGKYLLRTALPGESQSDSLARSNAPPFLEPYAHNMAWFYLPGLAVALSVRVDGSSP
jgi:hypothetical protein